MNRRNFIQSLGALAASSIPAHLKAQPSNKKKVLILGAGISGLTVAHELALRGFKPTIIEKEDIPGGKARSYNANIKTGPAAAEHSLRSFFGFYVNLPETMRKIPVEGGLSVFDRLVPLSSATASRKNQPDITLPLHNPIGLPFNLRNIYEYDNFIYFLFDIYIKQRLLTRQEINFVGRKLWYVATSCQARRMDELEDISWWEYIEAENQSENFKKYVAYGLTRSMQAMDPRTCSARSVAITLVRILTVVMSPGVIVDQVLDRPTSVGFIEPWVDHLKSLGCEFHFNTAVESFIHSNSKIESIVIKDRNGDSLQMAADYFVSAIPTDALTQIISTQNPELDAVDELKKLKKLKIEWFNGFQFYFRKSLPNVKNHTIFYDSPWQIIAAAQDQHWKDFENYVPKGVKGLLSIAISDWQTPGFNGKSAKDCSPEEIASELWDQLKSHLDVEDFPIEKEDIVDWHLDNSIRYENDRIVENTGGIYVNSPGDWHIRCNGEISSLINLVLSTAHIQTEMDIESMEAANESGKISTNILLKKMGFPKSKFVKIIPLREPALLSLIRLQDSLTYESDNW